MSALAFNLDNMSLSELNVTIEELTKIKAFKVEKQNLEEYLSFLPKDVVETVIKEKYSYLFPESVVQLVKESHFANILISNSFVDYSIKCEIKNGKMVALFYYINEIGQSQMGTIHTESDWDGFYNLLKLCAEVMNTNDRAFTKEKMIQVLRPELAESTCSVYPFYTAFIGNTHVQMNNLKSYIRKIGCRYEEILSRY